MDKSGKKSSIKVMPVQKVKSDYQITLKLQLFMTFITTILVIVAFFKRDFFAWLEFFLGLDLFVLAFNNAKYYKRAYMNWVYSAAGVAMILVSILKWCDIL